MKRRKQPPAKRRYDEKHPVVSVRITKELKEILDRYKGDKSYSEMIGIAIENMGNVYNEIRKEFENRLEEERRKSYSEGYNEGLEAGRKEGYEKGWSDGYSEGYRIGGISGYIKGREEEKEEMKPKLERLKKLEEERRQNPYIMAYNMLTELEEDYIKKLIAVKRRMSILKWLKTECEIYGIDDEEIKSLFRYGKELSELWLLFGEKLEEANAFLKAVDLEEYIMKMEEERKKKEKFKTKINLLKMARKWTSPFSHYLV